MITVELSSRGGLPVEPNRLQLLPKRYSWAAVGGPEQAEIAVVGTGPRLFEILNWLRYPVTLNHRGYVGVWWGYVHEVEVSYGAVTVGASLDALGNSVAVAFTETDPVSHATLQDTTAWSTDATSTAEYGTRQLLLSFNGEEAAAIKLRDTALAARKWPAPTVRVGSLSEPGGVLRCRGWWDTLSWKYYTNAGTDDVDTATQASDAITDAGQFLSGTKVLDTSGVTTLETREGNQTALDEIASLLEVGTTNGRRLLARVRADRKVEIYEEPASSTVDYYLTADGALHLPSSRVVRPESCPNAAWVHLRDVVGLSANLSWVANPSPFFLERTEYDCESGQLTIEPRVVEAPWTLGLAPEEG